jgi:hypothetical protein
LSKHACGVAAVEPLHVQAILDVGRTAAPG